MNMEMLLHPELLWLVPALIAAGAATGFLAGLFGVGGGAITVPVVYQALRSVGVSDAIAMPMAIGTSLAVIIPTSLSSTRAHLQRDAVDRDLWKRWIVPVTVGVLVGAVIARYAPSGLFKIMFIAICALSIWRFLGGYTNWRLGDKMPDNPVLAAQGFAIGLCSSLMGVGGGQLVNLVMSLYGASLIRAVATSAAVGLVVAVPGALGYMVAGLGKEGLPPFSIGFVSLLGFVLVAPLAVIMAPLGARVAHSWTRRQLEVAFGSFLILICLRFLVSLILGV